MKTKFLFAFTLVIMLTTPAMSSSAESGSPVIGFIILGGLLCLYFAPTILAVQRKLDRGTGLLFAINLFLGWTVLFWLFCLLWAVVGQTKHQALFYRREFNAAMRNHHP